MRDISTEYTPLASAQEEALTFCEEILPQVSRTFAVNIQCLRGDLYRAVLCGYLFCRIIDTAEDALVLSTSVKAASLRAWALQFPFQNRPDELTSWKETLLLNSKITKPITSNPAEIRLLENCERVFVLYYSLRPELQKHLYQAITTMANGMARFQEEMPKTSFQQGLRTFQDLEQYCYFVAGTVGEMLTGLFLDYLPDLESETKKILKAHAVAFGLGLQLTNILKDIRDDQKRNWCYIPQDLLIKEGLKTEDLFVAKNLAATYRLLQPVIQKAREALDKALIYCLSLPKSAPELRLFCLLPLHFAIQTLAKYEKEAFSSSTPGKIKITRRAVSRTLLWTRLFVKSNTAQKVFYSFYARHARV